MFLGGWGGRRRTRGQKCPRSNGHAPACRSPRPNELINRPLVPHNLSPVERPSERGHSCPPEPVAKAKSPMFLTGCGGGRRRTRGQKCPRSSGHAPACRSPRSNELINRPLVPHTLSTDRNTPSERGHSCPPEPVAKAKSPMSLTGCGGAKANSRTEMSALQCPRSNGRAPMAALQWPRFVVGATTVRRLSVVSTARTARSRN